MADQSGNVVLPKELRLAPPATMPQSRSYMFKQQAALSNYRPGDTIQINIPRLQRSYLTKDSYLEFDVEFTYTPIKEEVSLCLDTPGALGLIDRIEVYDYLGSTQLESTAQFGPLVALLQDTCITSQEYSTHWDATGGGQAANIVVDFERWNSKNTELNSYRQLAPNVGEIVDAAEYKKGGASQGAMDKPRTIHRRYHIPLFSFLGLLSPKYAPLHNGYTLMITLQTAANALSAVGISGDTPGSRTVVTGNGVDYTVNAARMDCQILELGPVAESMLLSTVGAQPMIITTKAYRNYTAPINAGSSTFRLDLNINVASLTNILWIMRPSSFANNLENNSLSYRQRNFLESWYFQYGSSILPQTQGITCFKPFTNNAEDWDGGSECLVELLKARHMYNQPNHRHVFNKWNFAWDNAERAAAFYTDRSHGSTALKLEPAMFDAAVADCLTEHGKFACGLDLELVSGRTNEIICGMNTNGMNTSIFATFNSTAAAGTLKAKGIEVQQVRVDAWCEYDAFINISPGIATTVSF